MYSKIYRKLVIYRYLFLFLKLILSLICLAVFILFSFELYITFSVNAKIDDEIVNTEIVEKPILQINDDDNRLTFVTSNFAIIKDSYNDIKLKNVDIKSYFVNGTAETIVFDGKSDEITLQNRPKLIFYNNGGGK
ncbi:MAG: hypothetical protein IJ853_02340 [Rickettsiales bacterium]|nr:hypothetical protein [Rickettsiales bacterium]